MRKEGFAFGNIAKIAILTPIVVILLTIGWYQQAMNHVDIPKAIKSKQESFIIAGYFINWGIYERKHNVVDLKADKLSHVLYAFANVNLDGSVVLGDSWADTDIKFEKGIA